MPGPEIRHHSKFAPVSGRELRHRVFDGKEAAQRLGIALPVVTQWPGDDHLVTDIGVHFAVMVGDWPVDIEKEPGDQVVDAQLAEPLGECRRTGYVEEHHDTLFAARPMVGAEQKTAEHPSADQPPELEDRTGHQRSEKNRPRIHGSSRTTQRSEKNGTG